MTLHLSAMGVGRNNYHACPIEQVEPRCFLKAGRTVRLTVILDLPPWRDRVPRRERTRRRRSIDQSRRDQRSVVACCPCRCHG